MVDNVGFSFHTPKGGKGSRSREQGPSFKLIAARRYAGLVVVYYGGGAPHDQRLRI